MLQDYENQKQTQTDIDWLYRSFPTLLIVLSALKPITKDLSFPVVVLIETIILVPLTQIGWLFNRIRGEK